METIVFYGLGGISLLSAGVLITRRQPVAAVIWLLVLVLSLAGMFFALQAEFLGVLQIFLYGDAITVIFIFIIMAMNIPDEELPDEKFTVPGLVAAGVSIVVAVLFVRSGMSTSSSEATEVSEGFGSITSFAETMFQEHFLAFEAVSVLLLVAIVGVVVLSRKHVVE